MTIKECATCPRYSAKEQRQRNGLYCVFCCEKHIEQASKNALKYNLSVSGEDFGIEAEYEHGNKVYGSGKENRWNINSRIVSDAECFTKRRASDSRQHTARLKHMRSASADCVVKSRKGEPNE